MSLQCAVCVDNANVLEVLEVIRLVEINRWHGWGTNILIDKNQKELPQRVTMGIKGFSTGETSTAASSTGNLHV